MENKRDELLRRWEKLKGQKVRWHGTLHPWHDETNARVLESARSLLSDMAEYIRKEPTK